MPGGTDGFIAVQRPARGGYLAPASQASRVERYQEYDPRVGLTKARLKGLDQRHSQKPNLDSLDANRLNGDRAANRLAITVSAHGRHNLTQAVMCFKPATVIAADKAIL